MCFSAKHIQNERVQGSIWKIILLQKKGIWIENPHKIKIL